MSVLGCCCCTNCLSVKLGWLTSACSEDHTGAVCSSAGAAPVGSVGNSPAILDNSSSVWLNVCSIGRLLVQTGRASGSELGAVGGGSYATGGIWGGANWVLCIGWPTPLTPPVYNPCTCCALKMKGGRHSVYANCSMGTSRYRSCVACSKTAEASKLATGYNTN